MHTFKIDKTTVLSCLGAIGLHLSLLLLFFYSMNHVRQQVIRLGGQNVKVISSFLYMPKKDVNKNTSFFTKKSNTLNKQTITKPAALNALNKIAITAKSPFTKSDTVKLQQKKQETTSTYDVSSATAKKFQSDSNNDEKVSELLKLLHLTIQKHQRYPANALQLNKQGRVTLAFTLLTNGYVKNLVVLKSSGVSSLDEAALAAINEAVPFLFIKDYLSEPKAFNIDVVFDLD